MSSAVFSPNGKFIVTASVAAGGSSPPTLGMPTWAKLWDGASGKELAVLEQGSATTCTGISQDGRLVLTGTLDGVGRVWSFDRNADPIGRPAATSEARVEFARAHLPRCLTHEQREKAFLAPEPPAWCIEMAKWPYQSQDWKDWLEFTTANAKPPLPDTDAWQPWIAAHRAEAR
jgi:hypothetical protein